jgi:hypothetical protein
MKLSFRRCYGERLRSTQYVVVWGKIDQTVMPVFSGSAASRQ